MKPIRNGWPHQILYFMVRIVSGILRMTSSTTHRLFERISQSPGIPVANPSASYWHIPPSRIAKHGSDGSIALPEYADVVVIGSGITGTSFARTVMREYQIEQQPLTVVMVEARDVCSGATGRNGGHITPVLYPHYRWLKEEFGERVAKDIIRFRLKHLPELLKVAAEEELLEESQCRQVEYFDVFHDKQLYSEAKEMLSEYQKDLPLEGSSYKTYEGDETIKRLQLSSPRTVGCLSTRGGAVHPYRLVTGILERLLEQYPQNFYLFTHTPCTAIKTCPEGLYEVLTPKGAIKTRHVVHATNAWASHLLPGMRERIIPLREAMTAQKPREGLGNNDKKTWTGGRSFVFYPRGSLFDFDYLTQQPLGEIMDDEKTKWPTTHGELMFGCNAKGIEDIGNADDRGWNEEAEWYLQKALGEYFKVDGGGDREEIKGIWSGIIGTSSDGMPWVGRVPEIVSGRKASSRGKAGMAAAGEWIAAGYSGEGMVHAWLSGKTVAEMVVGYSGSSLPSEFRMEEGRWRAARGVERVLVRLTRVI